MKLIHLESLTIEQFDDDEIPHYAILSHTWGKQEINYQEMLNPTEQVTQKHGYKKIAQFAHVARSKQYKFWNWNEEGDTDFKAYLEYGWVDTCCIDKSSSAELSESLKYVAPNINVCYD